MKFKIILIIVAISAICGFLISRKNHVTAVDSRPLDGLSKMDNSFNCLAEGQSPENIENIEEIIVDDQGVVVNQTIKNRILSVATKFFKVYWDEEDNRFLNPKYPPDVYYYADTQRFDVVFSTGLPEPGVSIILDNSACYGNISFQGALALGDPPVKDVISHHLQLYSFEKFVDLMHKYEMDYDSRK